MTKTLVYFNVYARAEPMRMMLKHAGADFKDERVSFEDWPAIKAAGKYPGGTLPVWHQDGQWFMESKAILRYIGVQHGYYPTDYVVAWKADAIVDFLVPFYDLIAPRLL